MTSPLVAQASAGGVAVVHLNCKVVPGASKADIAGRYGERLKLRVTAAAESGKANKAVLRLLADALGVAPTTLSVLRGATTPLKTIEIRGVALAEARARLLGEE